MPLSENTARDFDMYKTNKMIEPRTQPERGEHHSELNSAWIHSSKNIAVPHIRGQKFQLDRRLVLHNAIPSWTLIELNSSKSLVAPSLVGSEFESAQRHSELNSERIELFDEPGRT